MGTIMFTNENGKTLEVVGGKTLVLQQVEKTLEVTAGGLPGRAGIDGTIPDVIDCGTFE